MAYLVTSQMDPRLVTLAGELGGALVTDDDGLRQAAQREGVPVLAGDDLARMVAPRVLPGDEIAVTLTREGKEPNQAIAYLEDGTMVVVENAKPHIGQQVTIQVASVLRTVRGYMVFGDLTRD